MIRVGFVELFNVPTSSEPTPQENCKVQITSQSSLQDSPSIVYANGNYYLAYQSHEKGYGIFLKKFDSDWKKLKKVQVTSKSSLHDRPSMTYAGGYFYVAYFSKETRDYDIFVKRLDSNLNLASWKKQITSESSSQSYPFITFVNNQFVISYASTESGTRGIYMKKYSSTWNFIEKTKVIASSANERRASHTWDGSNFWVAYVYNHGDSKDWNIFAITPGCADVPSPTPSSSCCPTIEVTAGTEAYFPGDTVYITIALAGRNCCLQLRKPSPVSLIAPNGEVIVQQDLASLFSGSICPGTHSKFGMPFKLLEDAPSGYYDVKVSLSGGECTKTVNDVFFVDWL